MKKRGCCWPGCTVMVPASMWGCKAHWFRLPKSIRDLIWAAYRPGQEDADSVSIEYAAAFHLALAFAERANAEGARRIAEGGGS